MSVTNLSKALVACNRGTCALYITLLASYHGVEVLCFASEWRYHSAITYNLIKGGIEQLGIQVLGIVMVAGWCMSLSGVFFYILKKKDLLRIDAASELVGIDHTDYGGSAYPNFQQVS